MCRLELLQPCLMNLVKDGSTEKAAHTALAKLLIKRQDDPELFLSNSKHYDALEAGQYAEDMSYIDLALSAYR